MIIKVTQRLINKGCKNSLNCPVALAIKEQTGLAIEVNGPDFYFFNSSAIGSINDKYVTPDTPRSVQRFVTKFDSKGGKKKVKPFNFKLPKVLCELV